MTLFAVQPVDIGAVLGGLLPGLAQDLAGNLFNGADKTFVFFKRARPQRQVKLQSRPGGARATEP